MLCVEFLIPIGQKDKSQVYIKLLYSQDCWYSNATANQLHPSLPSDTTEAPPFPQNHCPSTRGFTHPWDTTSFLQKLRPSIRFTILPSEFSLSNQKLPPHVFMDTHCQGYDTNTNTTISPSPSPCPVIGCNTVVWLGLSNFLCYFFPVYSDQQKDFC